MTAGGIAFDLSDDPERDMDTHLAVLYSIARFLPSKVTVEIGTDDGSSLAPLLKAAKETVGVVYSIDPDIKPEAYAVGRDANDSWLPLLTKSEYACVVIPAIDLLFIDGDHSYEGVKKDWTLYEPKVRVGGIIIFHDTLAPLYPGIAKLINEEIRPHWQRWECCTLPYGWGLTIIRKLQ